MTVMTNVDAGAAHIPALRADLDRVRTVLDRTDAVLSVADQTLGRAQLTAQRLHEGAEHASQVLHESAREARRWAPVVLAVVGVAAVGVGVYVAWRAAQSRQAAAQQEFDASI